MKRGSWLWLALLCAGGAFLTSRADWYVLTVTGIGGRQEQLPVSGVVAFPLGVALQLALFAALIGLYLAKLRPLRVVLAVTAGALSLFLCALPFTSPVLSVAEIPGGALSATQASHWWLPFCLVALGGGLCALLSLRAADSKPRQQAAGGVNEEPDSAQIWDALSAGEDPTARGSAS
ncbi:Trp biosynthesis-associated membrane protein [Dermabacteraceae bacterium TAE3-ERU27]|nr:Trp biosynthesis-associated membrane protein [Dermabacteraceae bacterium TAE3-ERU27]